jgi:hypothetical protein
MCQQCGNNICGGCQQPIIPTGINGVDGINAFNFTTASFTMPAVGSNVPVTVKSINPFKNSWFAIGQIVFIEIAGYFQVVSTSGSNQVNLKNLGYSDINFTPAPNGTTIAPNAKVSPAGLQGVTGNTGGVGVNGISRVAYLSGPILSGSTTPNPKTFITQTVNLVDMPTTEGSGLLLTFSVLVKTQAVALLDRQIGVRFGGQECINGLDFGFGYGNKIPLIQNVSNAIPSDIQIKVEIIRGNNATVAYSRVSVYGIFWKGSYECYNEANSLTGLDFGTGNDFVIHGTQALINTFEFKTLTVDKIIAQ